MAGHRRPVELLQNRRGGRGRVVELLPQAMETPPCPEGLLRRSEGLWEQFWGSEMAKAVVSSDLGALTRWILAVDEWERVRAAFTKARVVGGSMGQPVLSPLAQYLAQLAREIAFYELQFGMTPMARLRLGLAAGRMATVAADLNTMVDERMEPTDEDAELAAEWGDPG